jgi:hypothetical protein
MMTNHNRGQHTLNTADRTLLSLSQSLRADGYGALADQMQVWLRGRVDANALRTALARLSRTHPVVTARLDCPRNGLPCWRYRPGAECTLHEVSLSSASEEDVLRQTAAILATPNDPTKSDPVAFHLLHLPDDRDLFLVQHDHCLMDINGTKLLVREINRLASSNAEPKAPINTHEDGIRAHLKRFSLWQRLAAIWRLGKLTREFSRSEPVTLCETTEPTPGGTLRIAVRELDEEQTTRFTKQTVALCGFRSVSLAILSSVFRAILRHTPRPPNERSALFVYLGTNLRGPSDRGPIFHNLSSMLPLLVRPDQMNDRTELIRLLNRLMRERIRENTDLAFLQWAWWLRNLPCVQRRPARDVYFRQCVNYGYMGVLVERNESFCGAPIERIFPVAQMYSPPALSVAPSLCGGRLILPVLYVADTVPQERIQGFLDTLVADLLAEKDVCHEYATV